MPKIMQDPWNASLISLAGGLIIGLIIGVVGIVMPVNNFDKGSVTIYLTSYDQKVSEDLSECLNQPDYSTAALTHYQNGQTSILCR